MGEAALRLISPDKYYEAAEQMLEEKDFIEFVSNVSIAIEAAQNDQEMLAKATYLRVQGLIRFNQLNKALVYIEDALQYNSGGSAFELIKNKGVVLGYLGNADEALKIFQELLTGTEDTQFLIGVYINIAWVHFTLLKNTEPDTLEEIKSYLDQAEAHFDLLPDRRKWKLRNTYSIYHFFKKDYDKAIDVLESSIRYCAEEDLPDVYNNLAELYFKIAEEEDSGIPEVAKEYLDKAEVIASRNKNNLALGYIFYTKAMMEVKEDQLFKALDTLCLSFEFFKDAEATVKACDTLIKINELMDEYKYNNLKSLREGLKMKLQNTPYSKKI